MKKVLFTFVAFFAAASVYAASVIIVWTHSPSSEVTGYKIYRGTSPGVYNMTNTIGYVNSMTQNDLVAGVTYYFVGTAIAPVNQESDYSFPEVSYTVPMSTNPPPSRPSAVQGFVILKSEPSI